MGTRGDSRERQRSGSLVILRNVTEEDLPIFFEHQRDPVALRMAGFTSRQHDAFLTHWRTNVLRRENTNRTIVVDDVVAGYIGSWEQDGSASLPTGSVASTGGRASGHGRSRSSSCSSRR